MAWHGALTPEALWRGRGDSAARVWVIVIAYLTGAAVCLWAWRRDTYRPAVWIISAAVLLLLAIDRKLDFLAWVVARGRTIARSGGWYWSHRRVIQKFATALMGAGGLMLIVFCVIGAEGLAVGHRVSCTAVAFLVCLVVLRAISLHEMDRLLYRRRAILMGLPVNLIVEPAGIITVVLAAICSGLR
jgi:hypothetical protein